MPGELDGLACEEWVGRDGPFSAMDLLRRDPIQILGD
jgi:hypothetical protein